MPAGLPRRSGGFTLLELLLAFVVFALSFAVVLEIIGGSVRSTVRAKQYSEAALLAQSVMEMVGTEYPVEPGFWEGEAPGGYRWSLDVSDFEGMGEDVRTLEIAQLNNTQLYWVDLHLSWDDGRREREAHFTTVRGVVGGREQ
jgi:general secretion pathway protein I